MNDYQDVSQLEALYRDPAIRERGFYPEFRRGWEALLSRRRRASAISISRPPP